VSSLGVICARGVSSHPTQSLTLISKTGNSAQPYLTQWGRGEREKESMLKLDENAGSRKGFSFYFIFFKLWKT